MKSTASKPGLRNSILNAICQDTSVTYLMVVKIMYDFSKTKQWHTSFTISCCSVRSPHFHSKQMPYSLLLTGYNPPRHVYPPPPDVNPPPNPYHYPTPTTTTHHPTPTTHHHHPTPTTHHHHTAINMRTTLTTDPTSGYQVGNNVIFGL